MRDLLKRFDLVECSPAKTPMYTAVKLDFDDKGKSVNITVYRGMVGSLLYLTASIPDIMFVTYLCNRFQANLKKSYLIAIRRIFRYLKGTQNLGLRYPKDTGFNQVAYFDARYARCRVDRKTTSESYQFLVQILVS